MKLLSDRWQNWRNLVTSVRSHTCDRSHAAPLKGWVWHSPVSMHPGVLMLSLIIGRLGLDQYVYFSLSIMLALLVKGASYWEGSSLQVCSVQCEYINLLLFLINGQFLSPSFLLVYLKKKIRTKQASKGNLLHGFNPRKLCKLSIGCWLNGCFAPKSVWRTMESFEWKDTEKETPACRYLCPEWRHSWLPFLQGDGLKPNPQGISFKTLTEVLFVYFGALLIPGKPTTSEPLVHVFLMNFY